MLGGKTQDVREDGIGIELQEDGSQVVDSAGVALNEMLARQDHRSECPSDLLGHGRYLVRRGNIGHSGGEGSESEAECA